MGSVLYTEGTKIGGSVQRVMLGGGTTGAVLLKSNLCTTDADSYNRTGTAIDTGVVAGMLITGPNIRPSTYVTSTSSNTVVMSRLPMADASSQTMRFSLTYEPGTDDGFEFIADIKIHYILFSFPLIKRIILV